MYREKVIWVDILCVESFLKVLFSKYRSVRIINYIQLSILFDPLLGVINKYTKYELRQINLNLNDEISDGKTLRQIINEKLFSMIKSTSSRLVNKPSVYEILDYHNLDIKKFEKFIYIQLRQYLYRSLEIEIISNYLSNNDSNNILILNKNPFSFFIIEKKKMEILFYTVFFSVFFKIFNRKHYHMDSIVSNTIHLKYRLLSNMKLLYLFLHNIYKRSQAFSDSNNIDNHTINIGVEYHHGSLRENRSNEFFWLKSGDFKHNTIYFLEEGELANQETNENIKKLGINKVRYTSIYPRKITYKRIMNILSNIHLYFLSGSFNIKQPNILFVFYVIIKSILRQDLNNWIHKKILLYHQSVVFRINYYKSYSLKIIWSMNEGSSQQIINLQAMKKLGGLYIGGHWSMVPNDIFSTKDYDIFFLWGKHFIDDIYVNNKSPNKLIVGYFSDHCFQYQKMRAKKERLQYPDKFIISYFDTAYGNDVYPISITQYIKVYEMLIELIKANNNVVLFIKPKKRHTFKSILQLLPDISSLQKNCRVKIFFGPDENLSIKEIPSMVAQASNLSVGIMGTAISEAFFSGTLGYHVELSPIQNKFGNMGLGKFVFNNIDDLKIAIQDCINYGTEEKYLKYKKYFHYLDPFQDGLCYKRIGFCIKTIQDMLNDGIAREEILNNLPGKYSDYLDANNFFID